MADKRTRLSPKQLPLRLSAVVCISFWVFFVRASGTSEDAATPPSASTQDLAKEKHNPFADQITLPIELSSSLDVGPGNGTAGGFNVQPAIPVSLGESWNLIARPSLSLLATEQPDRKLGLGDIELQTYLTPGVFQKWVWGIGTDLQVPTATEHSLGTGKWSAGPAAGLIYMNGPWVNGILATHVWSFAGDGDRNDVSQSTIEALLSYNFENGWFIAFDSTMTADWKAPADKRWTIPVGLDAGKAIQLGKQSLSVQFGTYYNVERAEGAARWLVRLQVSFNFPKEPTSHAGSNSARKS